MSTYGSEIPSTLPRPEGLGAEWVPGTGLPAEYPWYLRPIQINDRSVYDELQQYIKANGSKIQRWLYSTWNAEQAAIKYQEIRNALRDGQIPANWLNKWLRDYSRFINENLDPAWRAAWAQGQETISANVAAYAGAEFQAGATEFTRRWIEERGAQLVVDLTKTQRKALQALLRHFIVEEPLSAAELGRAIRGVIGLTPKQANAYAKARKAWLKQGLSRSKMEQRAGNYWGRLHRMRAARIARTELSYSYNFGQFDAIRQAEMKGLFKGPIIKRWLAGGGNVCSFCASLDGEVVGMEGAFPNLSIGNSYVPPAHPNCRCCIIYEVLEEGQP